jgi:hypothetical protein
LGVAMNNRDRARKVVRNSFSFSVSLWRGQCKSVELPSVPKGQRSKATSLSGADRPHVAVGVLAVVHVDVAHVHATCVVRHVRVGRAGPVA